MSMAASVIQLSPASAVFVDTRTTTLGPWVLGAFLDCILMGWRLFARFFDSITHVPPVQNTLQQYYQWLVIVVVGLSMLKTAQCITVVWVQNVLDTSPDCWLLKLGGKDAVVQGLKDALAGRPALYAFDAVSENGSLENLARVLAPQGAKAAFVLPGKKYDEIPDSVVKRVTKVGCVHNEEKEFGFVFFRYIALGLKEGWFKGQPQVVVPGGL
ncbi:hypothetical protein K438DRAFT_2029432 [Mycena galopus ATCC 62051]|nr:hypothetical protein K438DRAFT_2029432 [Mycena galopus ATCC 62051]